MTDLTQKFPPELLVEVLNHLSIPDVLRTKQVNYTFRDTVLASVLQHKIDLYAAGLEYNPATGVPLADSRKALQLHSNINSLRPVEERTVDDPPLEIGSFDMTAGGIYATVGESIRLYDPGSASRGVPYREWEIQAPINYRLDPECYCFYPGADVIAFTEAQEVLDDLRIRIHLRSLSDGGCHPAAKCPTIEREQSSITEPIFFTSITSSRFLVAAGTRSGVHLIIWDWRSAQVLFELEEPRYNHGTFVDDYRLLVYLMGGSRMPPSLVLIDTKKDVRGAPVRTAFRLPLEFSDYGCLYFIFEPGMHKPSPAEFLAPFHQDSTQRIIALGTGTIPSNFVLRVGGLLEFLKTHEGSEVSWSEWKCHVVTTFASFEKLRPPFDIWVSGCRLFAVYSTSDSGLGTQEVEVYDFSVGGRAKYLSDRVNTDLGGIRCLSPTGVRAQFPSFKPPATHFIYEGVVFRRHIPSADGSDDRRVLHIWAF